MNLSQIGSLRRVDPLREKLRIFLEGRGVTLQEESKSRNPETYKIIIEILNLLSEHHFGHEHFTTLRLGDWGGGAAKCSEYVDPVVHIFDFALKGPKRNLIGLLLHEIGHSFMKLLSPQQLDSMKRIRKLISGMPPEAVLGVDYLFGEEERKYHSLCSVDEFTAETYLLYVTQGAFTRDGLSSRRAADLLDYGPDNLPETSRFMGFLDSLDPAHRMVWLELWRLYKEGFGGIEYI